jgi:hypothetical protein
MSAERLLQRLFDLCAEQRAALRALDSARVEASALAIDAHFSELAGSARDDTPEFRRRLRFLVAELRHNAVLIAHARDAYRDAVEVLRAAVSPSEARPEDGRGRVVSVVG